MVLESQNRRVCVAKPLSGISKSQTWVFVFCKGQRKKVTVDSELARDCVSKFYWWVAIRSQAWGLVSLIIRTSILSSGFASYLENS